MRVEIDAADRLVLRRAAVLAVLIAVLVIGMALTAGVAVRLFLWAMGA